MGGVGGGTGGDDLSRERLARMLLMRVSEGGDAKLGRRVGHIGAVAVAAELLAGASPLPHAEALLTRVPASAHRVEDAVAADMRAAERLAARLVIPGDTEWPTQLDDLGPRAPLGLWVTGSGNLRLLALRSVSIVGARAATPYGTAMASQIAGDLTSRGWLVVSGGAFGIDAAAHRGALRAGGATVCILAGGIDVPYPRAHEGLLADIADHGLVVSETPPGGAAMRQRFLARNRVIAALTRATIVVEAALRSGSRTTAREAAEVLRPVMALPGPVTSPMSAGCHRLIRDGQAVLITGADEVHELLGGPPADAVPEPDPTDLAPREARVLDAVPRRRPAPVDGIVRVAGLTTTDVVIGLGILESRGLVEHRVDGWVRT